MVFQQFWRDPVSGRGGLGEMVGWAPPVARIEVIVGKAIKTIGFSTILARPRLRLQRGAYLALSFGVYKRTNPREKPNHPFAVLVHNPGTAFSFNYLARWGP